MAARRAFLAADAELTRLAAAAPKTMIENGTVVGVDVELRERMDALREQLRVQAETINSHPRITGSGNPYAAWKKVYAAASV